ncbi:MAG: outer membrane protein OmpA-like peptidoglycan-associated protein [Parvicella sp.]|jgi:outer membrane protein OmpA-like peptidoglycan-associated protein/tetratricopeptide (TPR) repeat protein
MKKNIILLVAIVFCSQFVWAQDVPFKSGNFKEDKEGFKTALVYYEKGQEYLELGNEATYAVLDPGNNYKAAIIEFEKAYKFNDNSAELNFYIGNAYLYTNEKYKADKYLQAALKLNPEVDDFLYFYLGMTAQLNMDFVTAIKHYTKFESSSKSKQQESLGRMLDKRTEECESGIELVEKPKRVWVDNVTSVNSSADETGPCLSTDGATLIFTSTKENGHAADEVGCYDGDLYITEIENRKWSTPVNMGQPLNSEGDEYSANLAYDGTKLLMSKNDGDDFNIYESSLKGVNWSTPEAFHKSINTSDNQLHAAYYSTNKRIYVVTDKKTGALNKGGDIFFNSRQNGSITEYGPPQTAGEVNSKFNEGSVFIDPSGDYMYFCSEGHNSMGGYDIFVSRKKQGQWGNPVNLGYPINTPYDDFFFVSTASGKYAYIASNREGGAGGLDLYKVTFWGETKELSTTSEDYLLASIANPVQNTQIEKEVKVDKQALTVFKGKTIDAISGKAVEAIIELTDNSTGSIIETFTTNSATGKFLISLPAGKNYGIAVKADGYLFHSENFDVKEPTGFNMINKTIELKNIKKGSKIALRNIFFESGKSTLSTDSNPELDRLVKLLKDVPALKIEISGHTDNVGSESMNGKLSKDRATAVVNYLTSKGIAASRLTAKGYGSTQPVADNKTSDGRQQNRRTEFEILSN